MNNLREPVLLITYSRDRIFYSTLIKAAIPRASLIRLISDLNSDCISLIICAFIELLYPRDIYYYEGDVEYIPYYDDKKWYKLHDNKNPLLRINPLLINVKGFIRSMCILFGWRINKLAPNYIPFSVEFIRSLNYYENNGNYLIIGMVFLSKFSNFIDLSAEIFVDVDKFHANMKQDDKEFCRHIRENLNVRLMMR